MEGAWRKPGQAPAGTEPARLECRNEGATWPGPRGALVLALYSVSNYICYATPRLLFAHHTSLTPLRQTAAMSTPAATADGETGVVSAGPTKQFFVSMITRDIELRPAIVDLIDNSVDGARRTRNDGSLTGLFVEIECYPHQFLIRDNCGGIPLEVAMRYAFRFGRPPEVDGVVHSVGQFGVGMKRALFKLGAWFSVESVSEHSSFLLEVDVPEWAEAAGWFFPLTRQDERAHPIKTAGTTIRVSPLHPEVANDFKPESFVAGLLAEIQLKHQLSLARGLRVQVNGVAISADPPSLLASAELSPAKFVTKYNGDRPAPVDVVLVCGLAESKPQAAAGWYVFCNSRLVLGPDQTNATVWGEGRGRTIPRFHTQFSRFRGYAFLDSDRPDQLPLTTTKVGVDANSAIWRATRRQMVTMTRPIIDFLNAIDWERPQIADPDERGRLEQAVKDAVFVSVQDLPETPFKSPARETMTAPPPATSSIQYRRSIELIDRAKELLGVTTNSEVGLRTFEYFLDAES